MNIVDRIQSIIESALKSAGLVYSVNSSSGSTRSDENGNAAMAYEITFNLDVHYNCSWSIKIFKNDADEVTISVLKVVGEIFTTEVTTIVQALESCKEQLKPYVLKRTTS